MSARSLVALSGAALLLAACSSSGGGTATSPSADPSGSASGTGGALPTEMTLSTNRGDIALSLDAAAPRTVIAQTTLAQQGYFDGTPCHRLVTQGIFVLQCGDPTGTGTGGPGYQLPDENLPAAGNGNYPAGTVAMANAGPNTAGSQFFIVYKDSTLVPPGYTIWGTVTKGLNVVKRVARAGTTTGSPDGPPKKSVTIDATTVR